MNNRPVRVQKRLLQFNQLPFAFGEVTEQAYSVAFKGESQNYTNNAHGSYYPTLGEPAMLQSSTFRATVDIDFRQITCEDKIRYARFIKRQLSRSGKLWAVQNAVELIWTNARVIDIDENVDDAESKDILRIGIQFELMDGVWRLAKRTRTFICTDYCAARFQDFDDQFCEDLYDYEGVCSDNSCVACTPAVYNTPEYQGCIWRPLCQFALYQNNQIIDPNGTPHITTNENGDKVIEYPKIIIPSLYNLFGVSCSNRCFINYSCKCESQQFCDDATWGRKFTLRADQPVNTTCFTFCARTDLPTTAVRVRLVGGFTSQTRIEINGDVVDLSNAIMEHDNMAITIGFGPLVYVVYEGDGQIGNVKYPMKNGQDVTKLTRRSNTPMFQINPGKNFVKITGNKKGVSSKVYIEPIDLTF